jgi:tetratricopeptide (TPR) repeat protein
MLRYVGQFAFPLWLCAEYSDYTHLIHPSATDPLVLASLLAWPAVMLLAYLLVRKKRFIPLLGMAWFLLAMLPTSNLIFPIGTIRADRLLFLPSLGFALMVAYGLAELARIRRKPAVLIMVLMLGFYGWRTISRNRAWLSQESLWAVTVQDNPGSAIAWAFVGDNYRAKDQHQQAAEAYQRSYQLRDGAGFFYTESHNNYAQMMVKLGDRAAAETHYRLVLGKRPGQHTALVNLGELLLHEAETRSESIELLRRATRVKPNRVEGYVNLAQALKLAGQFQQATRTIDQALQVQPENALLWEIKAECLQLAGEDRPEKGSG